MDVYLVLHVGVITRARCSHLSVITVESVLLCTELLKLRRLDMGKEI